MEIRRDVGWVQKNILKMALGAVACVASLMSFAGTAHALDIHVPADHSTIQAAVTAASADDVIIIADGTYNEKVTVDKSLTLEGESEAGVIISGTSLSGHGITVNTGIQNVTIRNLTVDGFTSGAGIRALANTNDLLVEHVTLTNNAGFGGFYGAGPVNGVTLDYVTASNNTSRGIVIWDGYKQNITITNSTVTGNNCCGIELQDGTASGVNISGNTISGNSDNAIGVTGLKAGNGANLIQNNTITGSGRFGIEIKLPDGTGIDSETEDGAIIVSGNDVSLTAPNGDLRDRAGIAVFRRAFVPAYMNADIPKGVVVRDNTVSGFTQSSTSEGFGIVVEGVNMTVKNNTLNNNDVAIQQQSGHLPYAANTGTDGDQSDLADEYFGRGNSPKTCAYIGTNVFSGNGTDTRTVGTVGTLGVTNTDTNVHYCSIQAAIDDAAAGHTLDVSAGTHEELLTVNKALTLMSSSTGALLRSPATGSNQTIINITAADVTVDNLNVELNRPFARYGIATNANNTVISNNTVSMSGTGGTWPRNGIQANGAAAYYTVKGNTVYGTDAHSPFEGRGIWLANGHGELGGASAADGNTVLAWFDVLMQFNTGGTTLIQNNTFKGGGLDVGEPNSGSDVNIWENNFAPVSSVADQSLIIKNVDQPVSIKNNTFTGHKVGVRLANSANTTIEENSFTPDMALTDFAHIVVNNKVAVSNPIAPRTISADVIKNTFHAATSVGGIGLLFQNHNATGATFGTFTVGGSLAHANDFDGRLNEFIRLSDESFANSQDSAVVATYPGYASPIPSTVGAPFSGDVNATFNRFGGLQLPELVELQMYHDPDNAALGLITFSAISNNVNLQTLTVASGTLMPAFSPSREEYEVQLPMGSTGVPEVTATPVSPDAQVDITPATGVPGTTTIVVTAADGGQKTYTVSFVIAVPVPTTPVSGSSGNSFIGSGGGFASSVVPLMLSDLNGSTGGGSGGSTVTTAADGSDTENSGSGVVIDSNFAPEEVVEFTDIRGHWAEEYIKTLAKRCSLTGFTDTDGTPLGLFGPNYSITRAELAQMMAKCDDMILVPVMDAPFKDVPADAWFASAVTRLKAEGVIEGYDDATFRPDDLINRAEALKLILASAFDDETITGDSTSFTDVDMAIWYGRFVAFAEGRNFISGYESETGEALKIFNPSGELTRAEAAKLIVLIKGF